MNLCAILGFDVLCLICEKLEVSDVKSFCDMLRSICEYRKDLKSIDKVLAFRLNPVCHFGIAFSDPPLLLLAMISHGIILSGSRATDFFYPDSRDIESDWSFSITADTKCMMSAVKALEQCGVLWEYKASEITKGRLNNISNSEQSITGYLKGHTVVNGNKHTVTLARQRYRTAIDCVIQSQNPTAIVFGHSAVCLYKKYIKEDKAVIRRDESNTLCAAPLRKVTQNRNDTGFHILPKLPHPLKYRRLGDDECETVDFTPYFDVAFQPFVRHLNLVAESKQWVEHNDTLTPLKFPFNLFGTIPSGPWTIPLDIENPSPIESMKGLPFHVYVSSGLLPARQDQEPPKNTTLYRFVNVGLGGAVEFFGNYTATLPI
ncbi:hypothetical protein MMC17_009444 [Xylographa soralifera]|nr:hypothetical protein [Xylographa soralifera]